MTQRDLSRMLQCTPRNVTGLVDALEAGDLVVVAAAHRPTEGRALVALTQQGERAAAAWRRATRMWGLLFADLASDELARFAATLDTLLQRLRDMDERQNTVPDNDK